jgi:hypothetical protein
MPRGLTFGNSQFSMCRDVLGDLRYNEAFVGRGYEDLWFIRETWKRAPASYRAEIITDADHGLLHVQNTLGGLDWFSETNLSHNRKLYAFTWDGMKRQCLAQQPTE